MKKLKTFTLLLSAIILIFIYGCNQAKNKIGKEITIECNLPLTGDLSVYGVSVRDGVNFALNDLKERHLLDSLELKFDFQDNQGLPKTTVSIFQSQLLKTPNIYISGVAPQTMSIIDQVSNKKIPHFVYVYAANICDKYDNTFRTWLNFNAEAEHYIDYVKSRNPTRVAILYVNIEICKFQFDSIVAPALKSMGIKNILIEPYDIQNYDFKNLATKTKSFKPDLIILNGFKGHIIQLIKDFRNYSLITDGNTMCSYDLLDAAPELSNELLEGLRYTVPYFVMNKEKPEIREWRKRFYEKYNREPLYTDAYAYDMVFAIRNASRKLTFPFTHDMMSKELLSTSFNGITGPFKFTPKGDLVLSLQTAYYKNGNLILQSK
jgi:branched-chain amino acid transport system substrate-binding protein